MSMSSFHRPRVYRSVGGCCICRAKSSSSRFTASDKYENLFHACFRLATASPRRTGEICNACVLLVKRYRKLPANSPRHWAHVVDARAGPGVKNFVKVRRRESCRERALKRKHVFRRQKRESSSVSSDDAVLSDNVSQLTSASRLEGDSRVSDFIDLTFWKRKEICCGTIFVGPSGEAIVDPRLLRLCPRQHKPKPLPQLPYSIHTIETMIATELKLLDRKDRKNGVCPLTPSTSASDSSPIPSSSEDVEEGYGSKSLEEGYGSKSPPPASGSFRGDPEEGYGSTAKEAYGSKTLPGYISTAKLPKDDYGSKTSPGYVSTAKLPKDDYGSKTSPGYVNTAKLPKDDYGSKTSPGYVSTAKLPKDDYGSKTTPCREGFSSSFNRKSHLPPKKYLPILNFQKLG